MKAVKNLLFVHADDNSLGPIFKAIFQKEVIADPFLTTAGLKIDSAGFEDSEGELLGESVLSALKALEIEKFEHTSKNIWLHKDLIRWADLILVPSLLEEDLLCLNFKEAWSKTLPVECYCGQYHTDTRFHVGAAPQTEDECRDAVDVSMGLLPHVINRLKDSYCDALVARGVGISEGVVIGEAFAVKQAQDLEMFREGSILVIDRPGAILYRGIDKSLAAKIIKNFIESPVLTDNVEDMVNEFVASLKGKLKKQSNMWLKDGGSAFHAVLTRAKALICSRGRHSGESLAASMKIPCISSCVGATESITTGQAIVVDAGRGEVYDVSLLQKLD